MNHHTYNGNCWRKRCRTKSHGDVCDVCHQHDEPRGECSVCVRCNACDSQRSGK